MIHLGNYSFRYAVAAGALGWNGAGYFWERPLRWLGLIDPHKFLVISKTLTLQPRAGHYRWWKPWQTVRLIEGGAVNAMGLPNPGLEGWFNRYFDWTVRQDINLALSIAPNDVHEAHEMAWTIRASNFYRNIRAIEVNCSCPNLGHAPTVEQILAIVREVAEVYPPVIVKLGHQQPYLTICKELDGQVAAFDLINTVPWNNLSMQPSPLAKHGHEGGVSGRQIGWHAYNAMARVQDAGVKTPILSGGGIMSYEDAAIRLRRADAISFGTLFLRAPWRPLQIIRRLEDEKGR